MIAFLYSTLHNKGKQFPYVTFLFCNPAELYKMVCESDETDLDIHIPTVMLPQDAGVELERLLSNRSSSIFFGL